MEWRIGFASSPLLCFCLFISLSTHFFSSSFSHPMLRVLLLTRIVSLRIHFKRYQRFSGRFFVFFKRTRVSRHRNRLFNSKRAIRFSLFYTLPFTSLLSAVAVVSQSLSQSVRHFFAFRSYTCKVECYKFQGA